MYTPKVANGKAKAQHTAICSVQEGGAYWNWSCCDSPTGICPKLGRRRVGGGTGASWVSQGQARR